MERPLGQAVVFQRVASLPPERPASNFRRLVVLANRFPSSSSNRLSTDRRLLATGRPQTDDGSRPAVPRCGVIVASQQSVVRLRTPSESEEPRNFGAALLYCDELSDASTASRACLTSASGYS